MIYLQLFTSYLFIFGNAYSSYVSICEWFNNAQFNEFFPPMLCGVNHHARIMMDREFNFSIFNFILNIFTFS